MKRRTKIVATLGPSSESKTKIKKLVQAGMNVARLNFSHGNTEQFKKIVQAIREIEKESKQLVSVMQDLQGPKIRLGALESPIKIDAGQCFTLSTKKTGKGIYVPYPPLSKIVKKGERLLIEDGLLRTKILSNNGGEIRVKALNAGTLKSHKGINLPDSQLPRSASLSTKDLKDLKFGLKTLKVDAVAVSFVETAEDILRVRANIEKHTKRAVKIIAKIERPRALENLEAILEAADGIMVARGDLGVETPAEEVPIQQRRMVTLARTYGKPVIIATQILQSMVEHPMATRAEISDAAHVILEHADAFMLSAETATGKHPLEAVRTLDSVAKSTEAALFREAELFPIPILEDKEDHEEEALALNSAILSEDLGANALIVFSETGHTARNILKHRPETPVVVFTESQETAHTLNFYWGIHSLFVDEKVKTPQEALKVLRRHKSFKKGAKLVFVQIKKKQHSIQIMEY